MRKMVKVNQAQKKEAVCDLIDSSVLSRMPTHDRKKK